MIKRLKSYFYPQTILVADSKVNGLIQVLLINNYVEFRVLGAVEVGGVAAKRFAKTLKYYHDRYPQNKPQNALILGFGGGNFALLLKQSWPEIKLVGVELDPVMVSLGKSYLWPQPLADLQVIIDDAYTWLPHHQSIYDLILVDLYRGFYIPPETTSLRFLQALKNHLRPRGQVIVNFYTSASHPNQYRSLQKHVHKVFLEVETITLLENQILFLT